MLKNPVISHRLTLQMAWTPAHNFLSLPVDNFKGDVVPAAVTTPRIADSPQDIPK